MPCPIIVMSGTWKQSHQDLTDAHISEIKGEKREGEDAEATTVKREKLFSILTAQRKQLDWRDLAPFEMLEVSWRRVVADGCKSSSRLLPSAWHQFQ